MWKIFALICGLLTGGILLTFQTSAAILGNNSSIITNITNATGAAVQNSPLN
jgi:hypothetical protein